MKRSILTLGLSSLLLIGCGGSQFKDVLDKSMELSEQLSKDSGLNYGQAIKETLELSSTRAASALSKKGAYSNNPLYRIAMPPELDKVTSTLRAFGLNKQVDNVEALMNRGAEQAAIEAKEVFIAAVRDMTITDAVGIINGNETAATHYFKAKTHDELREKYLPIIQSNLNKVGFYSQYKGFLGVYDNLPINDKPSLDLEQYALDQSLKGLFSQVAKEEASIRKDPVGRGSEFLSKVFTKQ